MSRVRTFLTAATLLASACGNSTAGTPTVTATTTSSPPRTTAVTTTALAPATTTTTSSTTTTLPQPVFEQNIEALAWGLFCRDLAAAGWDYTDAVAYWDAEGRPARMDADENGIPCETVYSSSDVTAYWGDPLPTGLAPGPGGGWHSTSRLPRVKPGCCSLNNNGPVSPALPPESGPFPEDGGYDVWVTHLEGPTDQLQLEIRRWLPCSAQPDRCSPDLFEGDIYSDPDNAVVRTVDLDDSLTVVIRPIGHSVEGIWTDLPSIEGDGTALAALLGRVDAALTTYVLPVYGIGGENQVILMGQADPTFPYGPSLDEEWILSYRGPEGSYLTTNFWATVGNEHPSGMHGWWCTLEIVDGSPVLYIWAGQIAG